MLALVTAAAASAGEEKLGLDVAGLAGEGVDAGVVEHGAGVVEVADEAVEAGGEGGEVGALPPHVGPEPRVVRLRRLQPRVELRLRRREVRVQVRRQHRVRREEVRSVGGA